MNIKEILIEKIKKCPAPPFLFIGSGLSQRYLGTPTWIGLLRELAVAANGDELSYEMYSMEANRSKLENGLEPKIAELIENDFNTKWFKSPNYSESRKKYADLIRGDCSPFKIEIANRFLSASNDDFKKGTEKEIELLQKVGDRSIAGVITTNYDTLIERVFNKYKYNKLVGQEELIFSPFTGISEIYKIHGCCTSPKSIIINNKDYELFNERNAYLVAKLLTIFLEHPIIFIGYKIGDSNIREILTSIAKCLPKDKLNILKDRFIFIEWNNTELEDSVTPYEFSNLNDNKSILMTKITVKDFSIIYEGLLENKVTYNPRLIKKMKEDIYNVVLTSEPSKTINVLVNIDDDKLDEVEAVVGFSLMEQLGHKGYDGIEAYEIYMDIVYNDGNFNKELIVEKTLPLILKYNQSIPVHKYTSSYKGVLPANVGKVSNKNYDDLLSKGMRYKIRNDGYISDNLESLINKLGIDGAVKYIPYMNPKKICTFELLNYIKMYLDENKDILKSKKATDIKRVIKLYDYLKYKKKA